MKETDKYFTLFLDGKYIIILGSRYEGSPIICWKYDILIGPRKIIDKYKKELFLSKNLEEGWNPRVIKI
jgi:hypothetical protein